MKKDYKSLLKEQTENRCKLPVGKHNDVSDSEFDKNELSMGIEVELEHTDSQEIAKCIAKDHLSEFPDYYTFLKRMEDILQKRKNRYT